ncbi:hypothetical protein Ait01nite_054710 [Actinoplanes italicus]|uniref:DUF4253 domain-containing protein n=1 Tax=Actinoplanes italicus TaxID=113567 RepID=A0A2T0K7M1_9ACTN|nr:hypothetical protein [Actinoplanes italicus]PRX18995.1 hypothetical protein CLV67_111143 [Actinoplanes italicus]GIE32426.1 hypothetical protein Ait01nite_054710 [Actinoplanes italicus]
MADDIDRLRTALRGTPLADLPIRAIPDGRLVMSRVSPQDYLTAWRAARAVLPVTGRRPVIVESDSSLLEDEPWGTPDEDDGPGPAWIAGLDEAARTIDPWQARDTSWLDEVCDDEDLRFHVPDLPGVELRAEIRQDLAAPTIRSVNRYVYDRVRADPLLMDATESLADQVFSPHRWWRPRSVELMLVPRPEAHMVAAWTEFHSVLGMNDVLAAALWRWHRACEAEMVACWETMLLLTAGRRPAPGDEAWELAVQLKGFATNLEPNPWEIALAVTRGDEWFLHDRP